MSFCQMANFGRGSNSKNPMSLPGFIERTSNHLILSRPTPMNSLSNYHTPVRIQTVAEDQDPDETDRASIPRHPPWTWAPKTKRSETWEEMEADCEACSAVSWMVYSSLAGFPLGIHGIQGHFTSAKWWRCHSGSHGNQTGTGGTKGSSRSVVQRTLETKTETANQPKEQT